MNTLTIPSLPATRGGLLRILKWIAVVLVIVVLFVIGGAYFVARKALPVLDGRLAVSGLSAPVTVIRDGRGVPTIVASSYDDLYFAQGYVTAQDRLWQMDIMRRAAAGELSEIVGDDTLKLDREQRILGLRAAARKSLAMASPRDQEQLNAYARGVNAFIENQKNKLPIEFRVMGYAPRPWLPEDSICIANQMVEYLNHGYYASALAKEKILAKLGPEMTADLFVNRSWHDRPPTVMRDNLAQPDKEKSSDPEDEDDDMDDDPDNSVTRDARPASPWVSQPLEMVLGSNDWVVSGDHTVTGKPLLSNDMHLGHQMPNLWYEAHLKSGEVDAVGVTLPGMPHVVVGHNQRIAWGFTNVGPSVEDVYIEAFDGTGKYQTPDGWQEPEHRAEVIHVKGKPDVTVDVRITRHGPIVTELVPGETRQLALRWTMYDGLRLPFFDVGRAQNWEQFTQAFSMLDAPGQNVVYADVDGNIGYHATGKIPIRAAGDGSLPVSGADNAHEWTGFVPFDKLPNIYNPPSGIIATANGRITPDRYPYSLSFEWEAPWRTERIYHVLEAGRKMSSADMLALQTDIHSESDLFLAERLVYAVDHAQKPSSRARQAADLMRSWDGRMLKESAAPTIARKASAEIMRLLLEPKLGVASEKPESGELNWKVYSSFMRSVWMESVIVHKPARWLPANYANYDELLAAAVESVVSAKDAPKDLASWHWGGVNPVDIEHPILGKIPLIGRWTAPGLREQSGSGYTVKAVTRGEGPSERFTANMADLDASTLNTVTGQGGNFLSPHYMDQWQAWYGGTTFPLPFSEKAVEAAAAHRLVLEPGK
jgi:penicillin G amidase